jgi:hypothetical protein
LRPLLAFVSTFFLTLVRSRCTSSQVCAISAASVPSLVGRQVGRSGGPGQATRPGGRNIWMHIHT